MLRACLAAIVAVALTMTMPSAQTARPQPARDRQPPRTPWGHPDLQGRWTSATLTPLERSTEFGAKEFFTEAEAIEYAKTAHARFLTQSNLVEENRISGEFDDGGAWAEDRTIVPTRRTSLIVGPTGRIPPQTAEAQQRGKARAAQRRQDGADSPEERPPFERCLWFPIEGPPMLPGIVYNSNYEIVQTRTHVVIQAEQSGVRIIPLDGRPRLPDGTGQWHGDPRGRWEDDTLVVETANFHPVREWRGATDRLKVVERFRRVRDDLLMYEFTVEDPTTWTAPWTAEVPMRPLAGLLYEYACHEGNYAMEHMLRGARAVDKAAGKE